MATRAQWMMGLGVVAGICVFAASLAIAKDKKKPPVPDTVLLAQTVCVLIDPDAAIPINDPGGNRTAQDDVERALMNWGRLRLVIDPAMADLVIVVRKGNKQAINPSVGGEPPNDRPVIVQQTDSAIRIGAQTPHPAGTPGGQSSGVGTGGEIGPSEDLFSVYQGQVATPLDRAPVWRYVAKDGLKGPEVRAVAEFKKAVDEAVKEQQQRQQKQAQQQPASKP